MQKGIIFENWYMCLFQAISKDPLLKKNKVNFILGSENSYCIICPKVSWGEYPAS